jgi:hypothetical protein
MMEKYATNSTLKNKNHNKEKNKEISHGINKSNINSNDIHLKNKLPKSEKQIQSDIKKIGNILNAKEQNSKITENKNDNKLKEKKIEKLSKSSPNPETKLLKKEKPSPINLKISDNGKSQVKNQMENNLSLKIPEHQPTLNNLKSESIEFALPEINISNNRKIENFFPYFLKTNLISLNSPPNQMRQNYNPFNHYLEYKDLRTITGSQHVNLSCLDPLCEVCDLNNKIICLQCQPGHFLLEGKCYNSCPTNYNADIYKRECVSLAMRQRSKKIKFIRIILT